MRSAFIRRGLAISAASAWLVVSAAQAPAQIVFDGNLLYENNATGTLAGQFSGTAGAGAAACGAGFTAASISVQYPNNTYADPLLAGALNITAPDFRPTMGSPAYAGNAPHGKVVEVPVDGFFVPTRFVGALGPGEPDWTAGWTYYDSLGAGRQDLHLPGMPDPRPLQILDNHNYYVSRTFDPDTNYLVRGQLHVKEQASLTIPAGVVVFEERASVGTIIIERGAKIFALGTAAQPIIVTTDLPPGSQVTGSTGGILIHGRARINNANSCAGDSAASEGGLVGYYGGNDDDDNSGILQYVRVEYGGNPISPNNELNSFTFNGVGRGTTAEYLQAHRGVDDAFEFFGGTAQLRYGIGTDGSDDGFDWQMGYRGRAQFVIVRHQATDYNPSAAQNPDKGIEADNNEFNHDEVQCAGRSNPIVSNFTLIGDHRSGPGYTGVTSGVNLRRGTAGQVLNSIIYNFKTAALRIDNDPTFQAHCLAPPPAPAIAYEAGTAAAPVSQGQVFLSQGAPNPFRMNLAIRFSLPRASRVQIMLYGADGRLVRKVAEQQMEAGTHSVSWKIDRALPSGVYFYEVHADGMESKGKVVRVD